MPSEMRHTEMEYFDALRALYANHEPIDVKLIPAELYFIVMCLQLASRHPQVTGVTQAQFEAVGRRLQEVLGRSWSDVGRDLIESGWHRELDHVEPRR